MGAGADSTWHGWGEAACLHCTSSRDAQQRRARGDYKPSFSTGARLNYKVISRVIFQTNTAIYLTAAARAASASQEAADLSIAKTETWSELLGAALGCHLFEVSVTRDPAAGSISGAGDARHLHQATLHFAVHHQSPARMAHAFRPAPPLFCSTLI